MENPRLMKPDPPAASALSASTMREPGATVVKVVGDIDIATQDDFVHALEQALDDRRHHGPVIVDLTDLRFFAACGVGCLNKARAAADSNDIDLRLAAGRVAARPIRLTGRGDAPDLYPSVAEARRGS